MFSSLRRMFFADPHQNLRQVLGEMPVPTFPGAVNRVLRALRDPDSSLSQVGEIVAADPGLAVDVLRLVNSAVFGLRRPVADASHAARLLGKSELENIVVGLAVKRALPTRSVGAFDPVAFWTVAARRAAVARGLADRVDPANARIAFTGALLQDMAIPLLSHARIEGYDDVLTQGRHGGLDQLEHARFGWDHARVAGWLAEGWSFPEPLRHAIAAHHDDAAPGHVRVAAHLPAVGEDDEPAIETARVELGLCPEVTRAVFVEADERAAEVRALFL